MGVWLSTDPAEQFFNPYGYYTNPILFVDPNGETFVQLLAQIGIGMATSALQYAANPNNYGENFGEGFGYALLRGALSGGLKYGTNYFLGNILPTIPSDNPNIPIFVNGGLEIAIHGVGTMFIDAAIQNMRYGEVDWGNAALSGGVAAAWTTFDIAINGAIVNERSIINRKDGGMKKANEILGDAKRYGNHANVAFKYHEIRMGGIRGRTLARDGGYASFDNGGRRRAWINTDKVKQGQNVWKKTVLHELFHLYQRVSGHPSVDTDYGSYNAYNFEEFAK